MARKIKRFLVFVFFSFFFTMFSKKFQSTDTSARTNTLASAKNDSSVLKKLSSVIGVNEAEAVLCNCNRDTRAFYCE